MFIHCVINHLICLAMHWIAWTHAWEMQWICFIKLSSLETESHLMQFSYILIAVSSFPLYLFKNYKCHLWILNQTTKAVVTVKYRLNNTLRLKLYCIQLLLLFGLKSMPGFEVLKRYNKKNDSCLIFCGLEKRYLLLHNWFSKKKLRFG